MAVGFPTKTTYANGDVFSASDINDTNGTINLLGQSVVSAAGKNCLINGGFDVWQRGTSAATAGGSYVSADRWWVYTASGSATFGQETTTIPANSRYAAKITSTGAGTSIFVAQAIETANVLLYAGKNLTFSGQVAASTSVPLTIQVQYSTSVDNAVNGTWTTITPTSGGTVTPTSTTYVSFTAVYAIPSTAKSMRIGIYHTGTVANGVVTYIGNLQAEVGSTATTFSRGGGTIQGELAACQRYYYLANADNPTGVLGLGTYNQNSEALGFLSFPVSMRIAPTASASSGTDFWVFWSKNSADYVNSLTGFGATPTGCGFYNAAQASGTAGDAGRWQGVYSTSLIAFSAEL
jgi:hypothetical protein